MSLPVCTSFQYGQSEQFKVNWTWVSWAPCTTTVVFPFLLIQADHMVYFVLQLHYTVSSTCWSDIKEFEIAFWTSVSSKSLFVAELPFPLGAKHYMYILPHCSYSRLQIVFFFPHPFSSSLVCLCNLLDKELQLKPSFIQTLLLLLFMLPPAWSWSRRHRNSNNQEFCDERFWCSVM